MIRGKAIMFDPTKMMPGAMPNFAALAAAKKAAKDQANGTAPATAPEPDLNAPVTRARGASTPAEAATSADNLEPIPVTRREHPKMGFGMILPAKKGPASSPADAATKADTPTVKEEEEKEEKEEKGGIVHAKKAKMARGARRAPIQKVWVNPNAGRENVVKECVFGEVLYSQLLHDNVTKYAQPLAAAPAKYGLTAQQTTILTKGLIEVDKFHQKFSAEMMQRQQVPAVILEKKDELTKMYRAYIDEYVNILSVLNDLRSNLRWLAYVKQLREAKPPFLVEETYLLAMQRMAVYELLLRKLSQSTSADHSEFKSLEQAMDVVRQVAVYGAEKGRQAENATAVVTLQNKLEASPPWFKLYKPERRIIRKGILVKSKTGKGVGQERLVFLLNDLLIWVTPDTFHYKGHVGLEYVTTDNLEVNNPEAKQSGKLGIVINLRGLKMSDDDEKAGKAAKGTSTVPRAASPKAGQGKKGSANTGSSNPPKTVIVPAKAVVPPSSSPAAPAPAKVVVVPAAAPPTVPPPQVPSVAPPQVPSTPPPSDDKKADDTKSTASDDETKTKSDNDEKKPSTESSDSSSGDSKKDDAATDKPSTDGDNNDKKDDEKAREEQEAKDKAEREAKAARELKEQLEKEAKEKADRDAKEAAEAKERKEKEEAAIKAEEEAKASRNDKQKLISNSSSDTVSHHDIKLQDGAGAHSGDEVALINGVPIHTLPISASWVFVADSVQTQELWKKDIDSAVVAWLQTRREQGLEDEEGELGGTGGAEDSGGCCVIS